MFSITLFFKGPQALGTYHALIIQYESSVKNVKNWTQGRQGTEFRIGAKGSIMMGYLRAMGVNLFFSFFFAGKVLLSVRLHQLRAEVRFEQPVDGLSQGLSPNTILPSCLLPTP